MFVVVASASNNDRSHVERVEVGFLFESACSCEVVGCLGHISSVGFVVISDVFVARLNFRDEG